MKIVKIEIHPDQSAIKYAKKILERCESGEITELTVCGVRHDGSYFTGGSTVKSTIYTMGVLMSSILDLNSAAIKGERNDE